MFSEAIARDHEMTMAWRDHDMKWFNDYLVKPGKIYELVKFFRIEIPDEVLNYWLRNNANSSEEQKTIDKGQNQQKIIMVTATGLEPTTT